MSSLVEMSPNKAKNDYARMLDDEGDDDDDDGSNNLPQVQHDAIDKLESAHGKVYREVILITISLFSGYAALVCLQKKLYDQWEGNHGQSLDEKQKQWFEHGTSLVYFGNLLFRLLHNVIFAPFTPRIRVVISLCCMCVSMAILVVCYWWLQSAAVVWVYVSYLFGGVAIGSFESNILATITPLGHETKLYAMMGIPVGFVSITVLGYALMATVEVISVAYIYSVVLLSCFASVFLWLLCIPIPSSYDHQQTFAQFVRQLAAWRQWLLPIQAYCIALLFDMFCLSFNTAINQYIYDGDSLPLFGVIAPDRLHLNGNLFFCILNLMQFIGDSSGRKLIYVLKNASLKPYYFLILSAVGILASVSKIPCFALLGTMCVCFANGAIYSCSTYFIDNRLDCDNAQYLLTSLSVWLFVGDIGSVTGSNVWQLIVPIACGVIPSTPASSQYFCVKK